MGSLISICMALMLLASSAAGQYISHKEGVEVQFLQQEVAFELPPQRVYGQTLVPMDTFFAAMGAKTEQTGIGTFRIQKGDTSLQVTVGEKEALFGGEKKIMAAAPLLLGGKVWIPLETAAEGFGYRLAFDEDTQSVQITEKDGSELTVHFIDVGQADAILLESGGKVMLIDGGNVADSDLIYTYLQKENIDYIDYMVGTHAHEDHMGGLSGALAKAKVGQIYVPETKSDAKFYQNFENMAAKQGLSLQQPQAGQEVILGDAQIYFYLPTQEDADDLNNTSLVVKAVCGETSFLFTADAEAEEEKDLLAQSYDLSATVLKAGHHGSDTSSSYVFLREVMPQYVVISVGKDNSYGHPDESVLSRFRDVGAEVYRTDLQGDIIAFSDGEEVTFRTSKNAPVQVQKPSAETNGTQPQGQTYIGNINTKKFHRESCRSLPAEKNRVYFSSREEAVTKGYDACGICKP